MGFACDEKKGMEDKMSNFAGQPVSESGDGGAKKAKEERTSNLPTSLVRTIEACDCIALSNDNIPSVELVQSASSESPSSLSNSAVAVLS